MKRIQNIMVLLLASVFVGGLQAEPARSSSAETPKKPLSGAKLWTDHCGSCHNLRNPAGYSDAQWDVAVMHMRVRANLTAEETRAILDFLKAAN